MDATISAVLAPHRVSQPESSLQLYSFPALILGLGVRDLTSGYKAFSRRALESFELGDVSSNGYSFQIELTYRGVRQGMRVKEVPIVFVDRTAGQSKMSRKIFVEAIGMVWKLRLDGLRGKI